MSIRVMIVDDSPFIRRAVHRILADDPDLEVVGEAGDGRAALESLVRLAPDVVTLDLRMPGLDGVETLEQLMAARPTPVVLLSSYAQTDAAITLRALACGAVDFVDKSRVSTMGVYDLGPELKSKLKAAAASRIGSPRAASGAAPVWLAPRPVVPPSVVVLGASTGGPAALETVLAALPAELRAAVLVIQHMPPGFTTALARRLASACALPVREARDDDRLVPGRVLVAPGGHELSVTAVDGEPRIRIAPTTGRAFPRVDPALVGLADVVGPALCAIVLTGMGRDGVDGARRVRAARGTVIAESESTCTLYGMPRAVVEAGLASCVAPLGGIGPLVAGLSSRAEVSS